MTFKLLKGKNVIHFYSPEEVIMRRSEIKKDPNVIAYERALILGQLDQFKPGTYVAFGGEKFLGSAETPEELINHPNVKNFPGEVFFHKAHLPVDVIRVDFDIDDDPR